MTKYCKYCGREKPRDRMTLYEGKEICNCDNEKHTYLKLVGEYDKSVWVKHKSKMCECCGINTEGFIYYQYGNFKICKFCYDMLEMKGDDE